MDPHGFNQGGRGRPFDSKHAKPQNPSGFASPVKQESSEGYMSSPHQRRVPPGNKQTGFNIQSQGQPFPMMSRQRQGPSQTYTESQSFAEQQGIFGYDPYCYQERSGMFDSQIPSQGMFNQPPPAHMTRTFGGPLPEDLFLLPHQMPAGYPPDSMSQKREPARRELLSDSEYFPLSIDDEEDEDYSEREDLKKNAKIYKNDGEDWITKYADPLKREEVMELIRDGEMPRVFRPEFDFYPNKRFKQDPFQARADMYHREKEEPRGEVKQLNYFYNVSNNFGPECVSATLQTENKSTKKYTKSIEIQTTPEKNKGGNDLGAAGGVGAEVDPPKKKRRRRTKEEVAKKEERPALPPPWAAYSYPQYPTMIPPQYPQYSPYCMPAMPRPYQQAYPTAVPEEFKQTQKMAYYPFQNNSLVELINQIEIYIQMLFQVLLFQRVTKKTEDFEGKASESKPDDAKHRAYKLLYEFLNKRDQTLEKLNLPIYSVPLASLQPEEAKPAESPVVLKMHPQVSYFQSPLLEIAPQVYKQMTKQAGSAQPAQLLSATNQAVSLQMQNEASDRFLRRFQPLINPFLLPISTSEVGKTRATQEDAEASDEEKKKNNYTKNNRRKFTPVDDNFLLLGLRQFGYKEVDMIRNNWLINKQSNEIKHRYKNLTAARAPRNVIKQWKNTHSVPLTAYEERQLARAVKWFAPKTNNRWPLISKCFLPNRAPNFLKQEYQNITQDNQRAERFGRIMLSDPEEENYEDLNLDEPSHYSEETQKERLVLCEGLLEDKEEHFEEVELN